MTTLALLQTLYNKQPRGLGVFECKTDEYFTYTYLPIKLRGQSEITNERRLACFDKLIGRAACDFIGNYGLDRYVDSYVYLIAKKACQRDVGFNRPGWHSDGFGTDDISYIWSDAQPTVFNRGDFWLSADDATSMKEMEAQADRRKNFSFKNGTLVHMDQFTIHKVGDYIEGERTFAKIVISRDEYKLKGNSINYDLDYKWEYTPRKKTRNVPQAK
jgi:hypothetical protein